LIIEIVVDWSLRKSYLVVRLDIKFDLFASEGADSVEMSVDGSSLDGVYPCASDASHLTCMRVRGEAYLINMTALYFL
jgi:hypothetical protein